MGARGMVCFSVTLDVGMKPQYLVFSRHGLKAERHSSRLVSCMAFCC